MKRAVSWFLVLLMVISALSVGLTVAAEEAKTIYYDFEGNAKSSDYVTEGKTHAVATADTQHGKVLYVVGSSDAQAVIPIQVGYVDKMVEMKYLFSPTGSALDAGDALHIDVYANGKNTLSAQFAPVANMTITDTVSSDALDDAGYAYGSVNTWYNVKVALDHNKVYSKIWIEGESEPQGWNQVAQTTMEMSAANSRVVIRLTGGQGGIQSYMDSIRIQPMTDALRAQLNTDKPAMCDISAVSSDDDYGTVYGATKAPLGSAVTLTAVPEEGCEFVSWTDGYGDVVSERASFTFTVTEDAAYTANFGEYVAEIRSFMAEGLTTVAKIDEETHTVTLRFASDIDLSKVFPYYYLDAGVSLGEGCYVRMDLSSGSVKLGSGKDEWTIRATQNSVMKTFYVNGETGNNSNDGLSKDKAFKTLEKAQIAVRTITEWTGDVVISIAEGEYCLDETMEFTIEDSPNYGYAVIWQGETGNPNDVVVMSGSRLDGEWKVSKDVSLADTLVAWEYDATNVAYSRDLYVDGKMAQSAKFMLNDNTAGNWDMADYADLKIDTKYGYIASGRLADMASWRNVSDLEFVYEVGWTYSIVPVESVEANGNTPKVIMNYNAFMAALNKPGVQVIDPNYILCCFEGLDQEGEWYFDREAKKIYYITQKDADPNNMEIVIPALDQLLTVEGESGNRFNGFTLKDIKFEYTSYLRPHTYGQAEIQASYILDTDIFTWTQKQWYDAYIKTDGGVTIAYAEGARVAHCIFTNMSASGCDFEIGCRGCQFVRNSIINVGANGVSVGGVSIRDAQPYSEVAYVKGVLTEVQPDPERVTQYTYVFSNYLNGIGLAFKGSVGISVGHVADVTVAHNTITNASYTGISCGWGWGAWDGGGEPYSEVFRATASVQARYVIEYNDISKVCQRLADGGAVYTLSLMPGSKLVGNVAHDNPTQFGGIYFDEATGGFTMVEDNIIYNCHTNFFNHIVSGNGDKSKYNPRKQAMNDLMNEPGKNYIGVRPNSAKNDERYQAILRTAGYLEEMKPETQNHVHVYDEWKVVLEATDVTKGLRTRKCTVCGEMEQEEIPMITPTATPTDSVTATPTEVVPGEQTDDNSVVLIAVIALVVLAGAGAGVLFVLKKKKNA